MRFLIQAPTKGGKSRIAQIAGLTRILFFPRVKSTLDVITQLSCEAAIRVKPKARLCEPWGHAALIDRAPEGR